MMPTNNAGGSGGKGVGKGSSMNKTKTPAKKKAKKAKLVLCPGIFPPAIMERALPASVYQSHMRRVQAVSEIANETHGSVSG
jgi:hypothetical protein